MTTLDDDGADERRSDKRRHILMPIENERRRGRDRRKTWELVRPSADKNPLPLARISDPASPAVLRRITGRTPASPPARPSPTALRSAPSATRPPKPPAPKRRATGPVKRPDTSPPSAPPPQPQRKTKPTSEKTAQIEQPEPQPSPTAKLSASPASPALTRPAAPPTPERKTEPAARLNVGPKPAAPPPVAPKGKQPVSRKTVPRKNPPEPAAPPNVSPEGAVPKALTKPKHPASSPPRETPVAVQDPIRRPPTPTPTPTPVPERRSPTAGTVTPDGDIWIGVPEGTTPESLLGATIETQRFVEYGSERRLVTLCHGPIGTLYRAWRPVSGRVKLGSLTTVENQTYQLMGSCKGTRTEFTQAYNTIFKAFPELETQGIPRAGEVVFIEV